MKSRAKAYTRCLRLWRRDKRSEGKVPCQEAITERALAHPRKRWETCTQRRRPMSASGSTALSPSHTYALLRRRRGRRRRRRCTPQGPINAYAANWDRRRRSESKKCHSRDDDYTRAPDQTNESANEPSSIATPCWLAAEQIPMENMQVDPRPLNS